MARSFNGTSDHIDIANETSFDFERTNAFSIAAWVYVGTPVQLGSIFAKEGNTGNQTGWRVNIGATGKLGFTLRNAGTAQIQTQDNAALSTATWLHTVFTYSGSGLASGVSMYVNNTAETVNAINDTLGSNTILNNLVARIGTKDNGAEFWLGRLGLVAVYNTALSAGDVADLYSGKAPTLVQAASLVSCWPLDDASDATTAVDLKGANAGTYSGATQIAGPPAYTAAPGVAGNAFRNYTLTCDGGTWTESASLAYQWQREDSAGAGTYSNVSGATSSTYQVTSADIGLRVRCQVTGTSASVSKTATSSAVGPITIGPPFPAVIFTS
ncbi:MAG TPA: LamG-like jellyroll fold domain-containing protein [Gaiellaceae bacterium]|nr:LamG-like jellyroll fold domain-containing protein [Gaiellaceae bacterium]